MLLALDVGNTNITVGLFDGAALAGSWRLGTRLERTADEYGVFLRAFLSERGTRLDAIGGIVLASVVPPLTPVLEEACRQSFGRAPLVVRPGTRTGMAVATDNPQEVGADRVLNAVAAVARTGAPAIVVDFGTATTFDAVSAKGEYLGGVIAPGIGISAEALFRNAARLPRVEISPPPRVIGRNTVHSMQSGLYWGYVALVDGVLDRMLAEFAPAVPHVLATGGLAPLIARESRHIRDVVPELTLEGLRIVWERNRE